MKNRLGKRKLNFFDKAKLDDVENCAITGGVNLPLMIIEDDIIIKDDLVTLEESAGYSVFN